jgi:hypothetical protein
VTMSKWGGDSDTASIILASGHRGKAFTSQRGGWLSERRPSARVAERSWREVRVRVRFRVRVRVSRIDRNHAALQQRT